MIDLNVYLLETGIAIYSITLSLEMLFSNKTSKFHKKMIFNVMFIALWFIFINSLWQFLDVTDDDNVKKIDYWLWIIWEIHIMMFSIFVLKSVNKKYYDKHK